jgi:hypothetical protein
MKNQLEDGITVFRSRIANVRHVGRFISVTRARLPALALLCHCHDRAHIGSPGALRAVNLMAAHSSPSVLGPEAWTAEALDAVWRSCTASDCDARRDQCGAAVAAQFDEE